MMTQGTPQDLTDRERTVVRGIAAGKSYKKIAIDMALGLETVRTYAARLRKKLRLNKAGIAAWAVKTKVVE